MQISQVRDEFNNAFPFLKLEFFRNDTSTRANAAVKRLIPLNRRLSDCEPAVAGGILEINEEMKVTELEKKFKDIFGLTVQVYRHSAGLWLQTTMTDNWTLQKQNEHGMEISRSVIISLPGDKEAND